MATNTNPIPTKFTKGLAISNKNDSLLTEQGTVVVNPTTNKVEVYSGGAFRVLADDSQVVKTTGAQSIDGSLAVTGNVSMAVPQLPQHGVNRSYLDLRLNNEGVSPTFHIFTENTGYDVDSRTDTDGNKILDYYIEYFGNSGNDINVFLPQSNIAIGRTLNIFKVNGNTPLKVVTVAHFIRNRGQAVHAYLVGWGVTIVWTGSDWRVVNELP